MTTDPDSLNSRSSAHHLLEELECGWLKNEPPDLASYLALASAADPSLLHDLVELDLEYRWQRFRGMPDPAKLDDYGFPEFPRLEHYAKVLPEDQRHRILTPELLAEEYRVRRTWGDRPEKAEYLERLPLDSVAVESALNQIETEFEVERRTPFDQQESSQLADESTWLVNKQKQEADEDAVEVQRPRAIGKYRLESLVGKGGFGEVWKAYDPDLKRYVALKLPRHDRQYSKQMLETFRTEAQRMATLERVPGIVPVFEAGEIDRQVYIVSYLVQGQDLGKRFQQTKLSYEESARIVAEVAETLHRAHVKNLFHRDVKLSNILMSDDGEIFLSDFGLCISEQEQLKEGHSTTGTYAYMAPEQIRGKSNRVDGRADIYALGVVLYRLLTGRLPFIADTQAEYLDQVINREPRPPRSVKDDIPAELERICLKCLNKNIKDRYTTARDLAKELRLCHVQTSFPTGHRWLLPTAGVLIGAVALLIWALKDTSSAPSGGQQAQNETPDESIDSNHPLADTKMLVWSPADGNDSYGYLDSDRSFRFDTTDYSLFRVGKYTSERIRIRMVLGTKDWEGRTGAFWCLNPSQDTSYVCWAVMIGRSNVDREFSAQIKKLVIHNSTGSLQVNPGINLKTIRADLPESDRASLEIDVSNQMIYQIYVNNQPILSEAFALPPSDWSRFPEGECGIVGKLCSASIFDYSLKPK